MKTCCLPLPRNTCSRLCLSVPAEEADEAEDEEAAPKTKKETQWSWQLLNDNKAIWLRNAKDVDEEEYDKFYQTVSKVNPGPN